MLLFQKRPFSCALGGKNLNTVIGSNKVTPVALSQCHKSTKGVQYCMVFFTEIFVLLSLEMGSITIIEHRSPMVLYVLFATIESVRYLKYSMLNSPYGRFSANVRTHPAISLAGVGVPFDSTPRCASKAWRFSRTRRDEPPPVLRGGLVGRRHGFPRAFRQLSSYLNLPSSVAHSSNTRWISVPIWSATLQRKI
jgi:hypothetical protein